MTRKPICKVPACDRRVLAKALCGMHYQRYAKYGTFDLPVWPTAIERLMSRIKVTNGCWLWCRGAENEGRGLFSMGHVATLAHRASWMLFIGPIPEGLNVCHQCDTPLCVNPDHLFLGTQKDNMQDCVRKGRLRPPCLKGEACGGSKLSNEDVLKIRIERANGEFTTTIAKRYGITPTMVSNIHRRKNWKHI